MHPGQPSGVVHPPRRRTNRRCRRRAGATLTAAPFSGIRYRYAAADSRVVARVPLPSIFLPVPICLPSPRTGFRQVWAHKHADAGRWARPSSILAPHGPYTRNRKMKLPAAGAGRPAKPRASAGRFSAVRPVLLTARSGGVRNDIDPPPRQLGGEAGVLPLLADGKGELVVRHHDAGRTGGLVGDGD